MPPSGATSRPHGIEDEGTPLGAKPKLNFVGAGVSVANVGTKTVVTIPAGGPQGDPGPEGPPGADGEPGADGDGSELDVKGFRSINAYGAVQGVATDQKSAVEACQDALAADGGGILLQPPGVTYVKGPITQRAGITFMGCGAGASTWGFNAISGSDTGAGTYGFLPASQNSPLRIKGTRIVGPAVNVGESFLGVNPCGISAIKVSRDSLIEDVKIDRFHAGLGVWADHITFNKVLVQNCYAAAEYLASSSRGDHTYNDCIFSGNLLAGILVLSGADINHTSLNNVHFVSTPFGALRMGAHTTGFLNNVHFNNCAGENLGNGFLSDLSTGGQPSWQNCTIDGSGYVQNDAYKYAGLASDYCINLPNAPTGGYIRNDFYPFSTSGMALGVYHFGGGIVTIIADAAPRVSAAGLLWTDGYGVLRENRIASGTILPGDLVEPVTNALTVRRTSAVVPDGGIIGICRTAVDADGFVWIDRNAGLVNCTSLPTAGTRIQQATATPWTVTTGTANPDIGRTVHPSSAGQVAAGLRTPQ